jgi:membrane protease YdiL (CAAX protease family)
VVLALLYVMTGALWAPIAVHILMDLTSGRISHAVFTQNGPDRSAPELAA